MNTSIGTERNQSTTISTCRNYYGNIETIDKSTDRKYQNVVQSLIAIAANHKVDKHTSKTVIECITKITDTSYDVHAYQLDILQQVTNYLTEINSSTRIYVDQSRYSQIERILELLVIDNYNDSMASLNSNSSSGGGMTGRHNCAHVLLMLDDIVHEIESPCQFQIFKSSLATQLKKTIDKQWRPIIVSNTNALNYVACRCIMIGLIQVVGKPMVLLYPAFQLFSVIQEVYTKEFERIHSNGRMTLNSILTSASLPKLVCAVIMLLLTTCLLQFLSAFSSIGYSCWVIAGGCFYLTVVDVTVFKKVIANYSPALVFLYKFIDKVSDLEKLKFESFISSASSISNGSGSSSGSAAVSSSESSLNTNYTAGDNIFRQRAATATNATVNTPYESKKRK